jgi:hypothetical protein
MRNNAGNAINKATLSPTVAPPNPSKGDRSLSAGTAYMQDPSLAQVLVLPDSNICNVWIYNFEEELQKISDLVEKYPIIAMVSIKLSCNSVNRTLNSLE